MSCSAEKVRQALGDIDAETMKKIVEYVGKMEGSLYLDIEAKGDSKQINGGTGYKVARENFYGNMVSYDKTRQLNGDMAPEVCRIFIEDGYVQNVSCP